MWRLEAGTALAHGLRAVSVASVAGTTRDGQLAHKVRDLARRLYPDLLADDSLVRRVLAERLRPIALGQIDLDELALRTLPERLGGQCGEAGLDRQTEPSRGRHLFT